MAVAGDLAMMDAAVHAEAEITATNGKTHPNTNTYHDVGKKNWNEHTSLITEMMQIAAIAHTDCTPAIWKLLKTLLARFGHHTKRLQQKNDRLKNILQEGDKSKYIQGDKYSWAAAAAAANGRAPTNAQETSRAPRKAKEVTITFGDDKDREQASKLIEKQIQDKLNGTGSPDVVAIRQLNSKDIAVHLSTVAAAKAKTDDDGWARVLGPSARVVRKTYSVIVHGIRKDAYKQEDQKEGIERLQRHNTNLHPDIKIVRFSWPSWTERPREDGTKRVYTSMVVEVATPDMANKILRDGFVENSEMRTCEYYNKNGMILQCFRCQQYGHIAQACKRPIRCGYCGENHETREHGEKALAETGKSCAVCGKDEHAAWERDCVVRQREKASLQARAMKRPSEYPVYVDLCTPSRPTATTNTSQRKRLRPEEDSRSSSPGGVTVNLAAGKRGPGRPPKFSGTVLDKSQLQLPESFKFQEPDNPMQGSDDNGNHTQST